MTAAAGERFSGEVALVAAREIRSRVRGKTFRVATALLLLAVGAAIVIPTLSGGGTTTVTVGLTGRMSTAESAAIHSAGRAVAIAAKVVRESDVASARAAVASGRVGFAVLGGRVVLTERPLGSIENSATGQLAAAADALGKLLAIERAHLSATQRAALARAGPLPSRSIEAGNGTGSGSVNGTVRGVSVVGVVLLFLLLTQYNTWTLVGVMEEKASRVVEVLLATVRPIQLLTGKLLGIGLLVFAQAGIVVGFALAVSAAVGSDVVKGIGPAVLATTLLWLVLGYVFYSWVYAAAGSLAERQDQVQVFVIPLMIPMLVGYLAALTVAGSGQTSVFFDVLAYLPPTAPFAMPVLVGLYDVTWWQVGSAAVVSVVSTVGVARLAAVVYRRAMLRTGARVRLREVFGPGRR